jgi:hypothetical protein
MLELDVDEMRERLGADSALDLNRKAREASPGDRD